jgi:hypothetical protein
MQDALVTLGELEARGFLPQIVQALNDLNTRESSDAETRRRMQRAVAGAISALEALHELDGFRPVFFVSIGGYDPSIKNMAYDALPNIVDDPGEIIIQIIQDPSNNPETKFDAFQEMLRTNAPDSSKAKVAAAALGTGWTYSTSNPTLQRASREMRKSAIDTINQYGAADDSVYTFLERSYSNNFVNTVPDYDEIKKTVDALASLKTDQASELLLKFLRDLHGRRQSGVWGNKERQALQWVVPALGATQTQSQQARQLLTTIQRSSDYTGAEQGWARDALRALGQ